MKRFIFGFIILLLAGVSTRTYAQCASENTAFKIGEDLSYKLYFNWKFIWVTVGTANMNISEVNYDGNPSYRCHLITRGNSRADKLFVLRDTLVSVVTKDLVPLYYRKGALEGERYTVDEVWYKYPNGESYVTQKFLDHRGNESIHYTKSNTCIYDMLSMLLRARSFDANQYKEGEKINFPMASGKKVEEQTLIFRGKKTFKMENTGVKYRCLVFSFVEYVDNKEKEVITFYVTDDKNHLPVRLDMYLRFGSAKAFLTNAKGIRNPQTSIIKD